MATHNHRAILDQLATVKKEVQEISAMESVVEPQETEEFDLDAALDKLLVDAEAAEAEAQAEAQPVAEEQGVSIRDQILALLSNNPNKPTPEQIDEWKKKYGDEGIFVLGLDSQNVFIYTYLTVSQMDKINKLAQTVKSQNSDDIQRSLREAVVRTGVLWPKLSPQFFQETRSGIPDALMFAIHSCSYHLTPQQVMTLTIQL